MVHLEWKHSKLSLEVIQWGVVNSLLPGRRSCNLKWATFKHMLVLYVWAFSVKFNSGECQMISLIGSDNGTAVTVVELNTLRPRQNGQHFRTTFSNVFSWMKMCDLRLKFHWSLFPGVHLTIFLSLVQIMAWRCPGDKPLSEPMMFSLLMHICVTRPQCVNCQ